MNFLYTPHYIERMHFFYKIPLNLPLKKGDLKALFF